MNRIKTSALVMLIALMLLAACSAHPRKVDCERHLEPINAPAPASHSKSDHP